MAPEGPLNSPQVFPKCFCISIGQKLVILSQKPSPPNKKTPFFFTGRGGGIKLYRLIRNWLGMLPNPIIYCVRFNFVLSLNLKNYFEETNTKYKKKISQRKKHVLFGNLDSWCLMVFCRTIQIIKICLRKSL